MRFCLTSGLDAPRFQFLFAEIGHQRPARGRTALFLFLSMVRAKVRGQSLFFNLNGKKI